MVVAAPAPADLLAAARELRMLRVAEARRLGFHPELLRRAVAAGDLVKLGRGIYGPADAEPTEHHTLAVAAKRVPRGVICLLSALRFHGLGTQDPAEVWVAVGPGGRLPVVRRPRVRAVRYGERAFHQGVEEHAVEGVTVRVYAAAKTTVDCLLLRDEVGVDAAVEALRDGLDRRAFTRDDVWRQADALGCLPLVRPYLEALS